MKRSDEQQWVYRSVPVELGPGRFSRDNWERELVYESISRATEGKMKLIPQKKPAGPRNLGGLPRLTRADMPETKGLYVRKAFVEHVSGNGFSVLAACSGEKCVGRSRVFTHNDWAKPVRAGFGCNLCVNAQRLKSRRQFFDEARTGKA